MSHLCPKHSKIKYKSICTSALCSFQDSYGAFVRQLVLQKGEVPVKRNYYEKEDVPDMDHLLDRKRLLHTLGM